MNFNLQMMTLRGTITEKDTIIETLQKKTSTSNLIELTTEKEEYFQEVNIYISIRKVILNDFIRFND